MTIPGINQAVKQSNGRWQSIEHFGNHRRPEIQSGGKQGRGEGNGSKFPTSVCKNMSMSAQISTLKRKRHPDETGAFSEMAQIVVNKTDFHSNDLSSHRSSHDISRSEPKPQQRSSSH